MYSSESDSYGDNNADEKPFSNILDHENNVYCSRLLHVGGLAWHGSSVGRINEVINILYVGQD